jgi:hypothetical protein
MINLGHFPGKGLPNYYIQKSKVDYVLEGLSVLALIAGWLIALLSGGDNASPAGNDRYIVMIVATAVTAAFLLMPNRVSTRWYNFPVRVHEGNVVTQLFLVHKFLRVFNLLINLFLLATVVSLCSTVLDGKEVFLHVPFLGLMLLFLGVYYYYAHKYK